MAVTWNPSDKGSGLTLSNGNLTVAADSGAGGYYGVRATEGKSSGKWYWEVTVTETASGAIRAAMFASSGMSMSAPDTGPGWLYHVTGDLYTGNSGSFTSAGSGPSYTNGDIIGIALDCDAHKAWFSKNGTWINSGDPGAGTNEALSSLTSTTFYPAFNGADAGTNPTLTANFGASAFAYSVPSGFTAYGGDNDVTGDIAATDTQDIASGTGTAVVPTGSFALTDTQDTASVSGYNASPYIVTWNSADKGSQVTLSNGDLTADFESAVFSNQTVRATLGRSIGKYYFEVTHAGGVDYRLSGVCSGNVDVQTGFVASSEGFGYFGSDGKFYTSNAGSTYGNTYNTEVISVAVDLDANKIWFAKSGVWQNSGDPAAGTNPASSSLYSGTLYPASMGSNSSQDPKTTANFGATAFSYTVPSGFSAWNEDFKNELTFAVTDTQDTAAFVASYPAYGSLSVTDTADVAAVAGEAANTEVPVFAAVGNDGKITYSEDGSTWTVAASPVTTQLNGIKQSGGGGTWIAVGASGVILRSEDLISWSNISSPTTKNLESVAYGNGRWIAVGATGTIIYSDDDGLTWGTMTSGTTVTLRTIIFEASVSEVWLAMGSSGVYKTSVDDGGTWDSHSALTGSPDIWDVMYCGGSVGLFVAVGPSRVWTSPDAGTWTQRMAPVSQTYGVTFIDPYVVLTAANRDIYYSTNGTSYTLNNSFAGAGNYWSAASNGTSVVIVGQPSSGTTPNCAILTDPTSTLTAIDTGTAGSYVRQVVLGDMATPTPPDVSGLFNVTEAADTAAMAGNSDTTSQPVVASFAITEEPDTFTQVFASTTVSGSMAATEAQDTVEIREGGGGVTVSVQMLASTFDAIVTYGAFLFNGGTLRIYSGSQPLSPEDDPVGTLLAEIILPDTAFEEAEDGECVKVGDWSGAAVDTGTAGWFRLTSLDGEDIVDGSVTTSIGSGDIIASTTVFNIGDPVEVTSASFSFTLVDEA